MRIDYQVVAGRQPTIAKEKSAANYFLFSALPQAATGRPKVHSGGATVGARISRGRRGRQQKSWSGGGGVTGGPAELHGEAACRIRARKRHCRVEIKHFGEILGRRVHDDQRPPAFTAPASDQPKGRSKPLVPEWTARRIDGWCCGAWLVFGAVDLLMRRHCASQAFASCEQEMEQIYRQSALGPAEPERRSGE
jgi:hypothetical protein